MHVLIIANHSPKELEPLAKDGALCLLSVGGKPIIEHTLESVARFSPTKTTIVASRGLNALRQYIGSGERWGLVIDVISSRPDESLTRLKLNNKKLFNNDLLVIECNKIRAFAFSDFLAAIEKSEIESNEFSARSNGQSCGLHYYKENCSTIDAASSAIEMQDTATYPITTPVEYHHINMLVAAGEVPTIAVRGRERSLGLTTGFMTRIHPRVLKSGRVHAGNNCRVHPSCSLSGNVVLNSGVVIDRNSTVENSLILDRTFVGENLEIRNSILSGGLIIRVDTGAVVEVTDRFLMAPLGDSLYDAHFADITNQLLGVFLFLLTLPLWPIALLFALLSSSTKAWEQKKYIGNKVSVLTGERRHFSTLEFGVTHRFLKKLPLLFAVATGQIRIVGVSLLTPAEQKNRSESWQTARDSAHCGLLGPVQLYLSEDTDVDEKILTDAMFAQQFGKLNSLSVCWQAIRVLVGFGSEDYKTALNS